MSVEPASEQGRGPIHEWVPYYWKDRAEALVEAIEKYQRAYTPRYGKPTAAAAELFAALSSTEDTDG